MNKYLYVDCNVVNNFSLTSIGFLTYSNIRNYIERYHKDKLIVSFDDFGNLFVEENVENFKKCAEYKKVAIILKGGRYEKV